MIEPCEDVVCFVDDLRMEQVNNNLLTNAIKYSPAARRIIITSRVKDREAVTSVRDFGIGIAKEHLGDIFNRFDRADHPDMKFQGLEIGLSITKEIIERHLAIYGWKADKGREQSSIFRCQFQNIIKPHLYSP